MNVENTVIHTHTHKHTHTRFDFLFCFLKGLQKAHEDNINLSETSLSSHSILNFLKCGHEQCLQEGVPLQAKDFIMFKKKSFALYSCFYFFFPVSSS